jgi:hypothetical protein
LVANVKEKTMTKRNLWLRMLAVGCDDGSNDDLKIDSALNGTWLNDDNGQLDYKFSNGNFEQSFDDEPLLNGTYSTNNGKIMLVKTHWHGNALLRFYSIDGVKISTDGIEKKWYSKNDLKTLGVYSDKDINTLFQGFTCNYSINSNNLTLTDKYGDSMTYTQK